MSSDPSIDSLLREAGRIEPVDVEPDRSGTELARYRITRAIGRGAMGIVYEAEDRELDRRVALKVLPRAAVSDSERRARFLREARAAAALDHPNIVSVHDVGEADGVVFIAMALVDGTSLRAKVDDAPRGLPIADAVRIAREIASGLGEAHARGIVHRDVKPENVMLDRASVARLVDFGLAKVAVPEGTKNEMSTQDGRVLGTPSYMAPEQAKGERVTPAADVFSLGVVLYELLTGSRPFAGESMVDILVAIARDTPVPPSKRAAKISRDLDRIVLRCLAKDPAARFRDARAVADALAHARLQRSISWVPIVVALAACSVVLALATNRGATPVASERATATAITTTATDSPAVSIVEPLPTAMPSETTSASKRSSESVPTARPHASVRAAPSSAPAASIDPLARQH